MGGLYNLNSIERANLGMKKDAITVQETLWCRQNCHARPDGDGARQPSTRRLSPAIRLVAARLRLVGTHNFAS
jgi:hypothetical protein